MPVEKLVSGPHKDGTWSVCALGVEITGIPTLDLANRISIALDRAIDLARLGY
jgi:hypothetical protein